MKQKKPGVKVIEVTIKRRVTLEQKACKQCGKTFMGIKRKEYCSRACVEKAAYHRNPAAYRESRMRSYRKSKGQVESK
jgi:hypothetical protein